MDYGEVRQGKVIPRKTLETNHNRFPFLLLGLDTQYIAIYNIRCPLHIVLNGGVMNELPVLRTFRE